MTNQVTDLEFENDELSDEALDRPGGQSGATVGTVCGSVGTGGTFPASPKAGRIQD